ncbi:hypothetical protein [Brevibacillus sp. SYSU BS000544]|uniref:hypothetical protein n=1 Tax=Brevibacillus sp. SYSU BS000544 TaxID=3416443 RepID=UPI003CE5A43A
MSLKAVELQVALPRTQEISRFQEQQQQRHANEQQAQVNDRNHLDQKNRQRTTNINETTHGQIKEKQDEDEKRKKKQTDSVKKGVAAKENKSKEQKHMTDPLRGHFIDISL